MRRLLIAAVCLYAATLCTAPVSTAGGTAEGPPFMLNESTGEGSKTATDQQSVARAADGSFVAVWTAESFSIAGQEIVARRFAADGTPLEGELVVNTYSTGAQRYPAVALAPDGGFVVVWEDNSFQDGTVLTVRGRLVDSAGMPVGDEFVVPSYTTGGQEEPDVAVAPDGTFVVVWRTRLAGEIYGGIGARRFSSAAVPFGDEFKVETYTTDMQFAPSISMDADGNFVVVWASGSNYPGPDGSNSAVAARLFGADATPAGDEFLVNQTTQNYQTWPSVDMNSDGEFVVVWQNQTRESDYFSSVWARRFDAGGAPLGDEFAVDAGAGLKQQRADVSVDPVSRFVVTWNAYDYSSYEGNIVGRCFDASGNADGEVLTASAAGGAPENASVAGDGQGDFVVVWHDFVYGAGAQTFARLYDRTDGATTTSTTTSSTTTSSTTTSTTMPGGQSCGDPVVDAGVAGGGRPAVVTASDALFILNVAVGLQNCEPCICDVTGEGSVAASDALAVLNAAVGIPVAFMCPPCT